jgi:hypothetical protein
MFLTILTLLDGDHLFRDNNKKVRIIGSHPSIELSFDVSNVFGIFNQPEISDSQHIHTSDLVISAHFGALKMDN